MFAALLLLTALPALWVAVRWNAARAPQAFVPLVEEVAPVVNLADHVPAHLTFFDEKLRVA